LIQNLHHPIHSEINMTSFSPRRRQFSLALGASAVVASPLAVAQAWPAKNIRMIVPFAPGGTSSVVARSVGDELSRQMGVGVVIDNKGGGGGVSAMSEAKAAAPDGYTIIVTHVGTLAVNPFMLKNQPYDVDKDFTPITLLAKVPNIFVINPEVPAQNFKEFIAHVKKNPGRLNYGSAGNASAGHLAMEYLKMVSGMFITHIPYRGTGPQLTDLLAGRTQASSAGTPALLPHINAGKLRAIATGTQKRIAALPNVPTVQEMGFKNFETSQWYGLHAPAGTPAAIVKRLQEECAKAMQSKSVQDRFAFDNAEGGGGLPSEYAAYIAAEQKIWKNVVERTGMKSD
jgi:tripartite-type tricarboxylate transporter receptor subunit TctC